MKASTVALCLNADPRVQAEIMRDLRVHCFTDDERECVLHIVDAYAEGCRDTAELLLPDGQSWSMGPSLLLRGARAAIDRIWASRCGRCQ